MVDDNCGFEFDVNVMSKADVFSNTVEVACFPERFDAGNIYTVQPMMKYSVAEGIFMGLKLCCTYLRMGSSFLPFK